MGVGRLVLAAPETFFVVRRLPVPIVVLIVVLLVVLAVLASSHVLLLVVVVVLLLLLLLLLVDLLLHVIEIAVEKLLYLCEVPLGDFDELFQLGCRPRRVPVATPRPVDAEAILVVVALAAAGWLVQPAHLLLLLLLRDGRHCTHAALG